MSDVRRILALDPASKCGFAHSAGHLGTWLLTGDKLATLRRYIMEAGGAWGIDAIAFEDAHQGSRNRRVVAFHNELAAVIRLCAADLGAEILGPYNPLSIKKWFTGSGRADKAQMVRAAKSFFCVVCSDDEADALAILKMSEAGYEVPTKVKRRAKSVAKIVARQQGTLFPTGRKR